MTKSKALALARRHGLAAEFAYAYRWVRPWWAFWVSEEEACLEALAEWDLLEKAPCN